MSAYSSLRNHNRPRKMLGENRDVKLIVNKITEQSKGWLKVAHVKWKAGKCGERTPPAVHP